MILVYLLTCGPKEIPSALNADPVQTPQVVSATLTKTYFEIVVRTLSNGGMKGFG